jgi:hypothetical protein
MVPVACSCKHGKEISSPTQCQCGEFVSGFLARTLVHRVPYLITMHMQCIQMHQNVTFISWEQGVKARVRTASYWLNWARTIPSASPHSDNQPSLNFSLQFWLYGYTMKQIWFISLLRINNNKILNCNLQLCFLIFKTSLSAEQTHETEFSLKG